MKYDMQTATTGAVPATSTEATLLLPADREIVLTDLGLAGRINGHWFKWWPAMKCFGRTAMRTQPNWWTQLGDIKTSLVSEVTGPNTMAWRATEPDAPGFFALISDRFGRLIPPAPETDGMIISVFNEAVNARVASIEIDGRVGLNRWYKANVGHAPDDEPDGPRPILELIDNVASHLMLRCFEDARSQ